MKYIALILFSALIFSQVACGQQHPSTIKHDEIPENWKSLKEANYSIYYPDSFNLDQSGLMGISFFLLSQQTSAQDLYRENINLITQNIAEYNLNLNRYIEISERQISALINNVKIIESKRIKESSSKEFHRLVYTGEQG
jgi:hypothetical protein